MTMCKEALNASHQAVLITVSRCRNDELQNLRRVLILRTCGRFCGGVFAGHGIEGGCASMSSELIKRRRVTVL